MSAGDKQAEQLPVTTSSIITESKGTFLGLDGMGVLAVFGAFVAFNFIAGLFESLQKSSFPIALGASSIMYLIMRRLISGRPDGFLLDICLYSFRPKKFEHRPRGKRPILAED